MSNEPYYNSNIQNAKSKANLFLTFQFSMESKGNMSRKNHKHPPWSHKVKKSSNKCAKAATTSGSNVPIDEVSNKIDKLDHAVKSLNSKSVDHGQSLDHNSGSS